MNFIPLLFYSFSFLLLLVYACIVFFAVRGINSVQGVKLTSRSNKVPVDIIIAYKNEAKTLPFLINDLVNQTYPNIRVIWVNDHSIDESVEIINSQNSLTSINMNSKLLGKKVAVQQAIAHANAPLILFTDADCRLPTQWVENYVNQYNQKGEGLYFGPVCNTTENNLGEIFALEFLSLVGTGIGLAAQKHPVYMNGANYGITKRLLDNTTVNSGKKYASGDDVFLLHDVKFQHGTDKIFATANKENCVFTAVPESIAAFIRQRIRWGAKANGYKDKEALLLAGLIFSVCTLQVISLLYISQLLLFLILWIGKFCVDFIALNVYANVSKQNKLLVWFPVLAPLYPFYITLTSISGLFISSKYWDKPS